MILKKLISIIFVCIAFVNFPISAEQRIIEITSLSELSAAHPEGTIILFDIDDTLIDSPNMAGTRQFRKHLIQATEQVTSRNWHDALTYYMLLNRYPAVTVEPITSQVLHQLQQKPYVVCGFTARERNVWYDLEVAGIDVLTVDQLLSVNIDFNQGALERFHPELAILPEYYKGIFFADLEPKGNYLLKILNQAHLPPKVVLIDDKLSQVESVAEALEMLGIDHECYWYRATEQKEFDPLISDIQLYYFWKSGGKLIFSDQEVVELLLQYPEMKDYHYIQMLVEEYTLTSA